MKKIEAIIRPEQLEDLVKALRVAGVGGLSLTEIKGFGRTQKFAKAYHKKSTIFFDKVKVESIVTDDQLSEILQIIQNFSQTGENGDGKIFVYPLEQAIRIRTGETNEDAIL